MTTILGADMSYDELTPQKAAQLRAIDIRVLGQCLWDGIVQPANRVTNLRTAIAEGFLVYGYCSPSQVGAGEQHAQLARQGIPDDLWAQLLFCETDVESPGLTATIVRACVEQLAAYGSRRVIYTSVSKWQYGDSFTDCLLHDANYDDRAVLDYPRPYGGWTVAKLLAKQYNDLAEGGTTIDEDIFNLELLLGEDDMTIDEVNAAIDAKLKSDVYPKIGAVLTQEGVLGTNLQTVGNALIEHVNSHPGGGASITMAAQMQPVIDAIQKMEDADAALKAAVEALQAQVAGGK